MTIASWPKTVLKTVLKPHNVIENFAKHYYSNFFYQSQILHFKSHQICSIFFVAYEIKYT